MIPTDKRYALMDIRPHVIQCGPNQIPDCWI